MPANRSSISHAVSLPALEIFQACPSNLKATDPSSSVLTVVIQAVAFGEHLVTGVGDNSRDSTLLSDPTPWLKLSVPGMASISLHLATDLYSRTPRYESSCSTRADWSPLISARQ